MIRLTKLALLITALLALVLTACGAKGTPAPTVDVNLIYTQAWQTLQAGQTQTAAAVPPTSTPTEEMLATPTERPTNTPLITDTPAVSPGEPTATRLVVINTPKPPSDQPCDNAAFVTDVTYPDGTEVAPNTEIIKTWRFKNLGPCVWDQDYRMIFGWSSDTAKDYWNSGTIKSVPFPGVVQPGETMDISITLKAPDQPGSYAAWFRLQNDKGWNFGDPFAVAIRVVK